MKLEIFASLLCSLAICGTIIQSDLQGQTIDGGIPVTQNTYPYSPAFTVPGPVWIWGPDWNSAPDQEVRTFRESFTLVCSNPVTISATADNEFEAYVNGQLVLQGSDWTKTYTAVIPASVLKTCGGKNKLEIRAKNRDHNSPAGLIYALTQDESCVNCGNHGTFNFRTCQCECAFKSCDCFRAQSWLGFPECTCGCKCPVSCPAGEYFNADTCSCACYKNCRGFGRDHDNRDNKFEDLWNIRP